MFACFAFFSSFDFQTCKKCGKVFKTDRETDMCWNCEKKQNDTNVINSINSELNKNELMQILKKEASKICIMDIMKASIFLSEDAKYVQGSYKKEYLKSYNEAFITRLKVLKEDKKDYIEQVDYEKLTKNEIFRAPNTCV